MIENSADFVFETDDDPPEREERVDPLGTPPTTVIRAGRRFRLIHWELRTRGGERARARFIYRLLGRA
jgi:hypothetical protein